MGCGSGQKQSTNPLRLPTVNGSLRVTIVNSKIQHETSSVFAMDPYIKLRISNQSFTTKVIKKGGKQPIFNQTSTFFINSCYKKDGRFVQLQQWDSGKTGDSLIGFGISDLDPILNSKLPRTQLKVCLNHELKPAGIVNLILQFKEQQIQILTLRFQSASIRRKTSTFSNMNCFVQVTIGEEVLRTKSQKDTKEMPPVWTDQLLTFNVPKIIKNCLIQLFDDKDLVGSTTVNVEDLLKQTKEQNFDQQIQYKQSIAGTLRFQSLLGVNPEFSIIKRDYKRKQQKKVQQSKVQDNKNPQQKGKETNKQVNSSSVHPSSIVNQQKKPLQTKN